MRCKACKQQMRPVRKALFPFPVPLLLLVVGVVGGGYIRESRPDIESLFAWGLIGVFGLGAVLLSSMGKEVQRCERCNATQAMSPGETAEWERQDKEATEQRVREELGPSLRTELRSEVRTEVRSQLEAEVRGEVERKLRGDLEKQLRPALEQEAKAQVERELRPRIADELRSELTTMLRGQLSEELRPQIEKEVEATLRPKLEQQIRASLPKTAVPASAPARSTTVAPPSARPDSKQPASAPAAAAAAPAAAAGAPMAAVGVTTDPHARAQRKARVIVSDIQLYNRDLVEKAARSNDPIRMLDSVWHEALKSYDDSVPEDVRKDTNYLTEAFDALMTKMRKELNAAS